MAETEDARRSPLEKSITEARRVLNEHYEYLSGNETATRALVIDVMLTALGWDIKDPARVRLEHRANGQRVDYVLLSSSDQFLTVVEAKPPNMVLAEKYRRDASGYATEIGARYAVLTNGARWEGWEMVPQKPRKDSMVVEVHVMTGEIAKVAATLGKLHRDVLEQ